MVTPWDCVDHCSTDEGGAICLRGICRRSHTRNGVLVSRSGSAGGREAVSLTPMRTLGRLAAAALAALCLVTTAACSESSDTPSPTQSTASAAQRLAAAKAQVDAAPSVHLA